MGAMSRRKGAAAETAVVRWLRGRGRPTTERRPTGSPDPFEDSNARQAGPAPGGVVSDLGYDPTDPDEWSDAESAPRRSESRRLASMVSVRFTPDEVDELRRRAARAGQSMSGYLRALALAPETITSGDTLPTKASAARPR